MKVALLGRRRSGDGMKLPVGEKEDGGIGLEERKLGCNFTWTQCVKSFKMQQQMMNENYKPFKDPHPQHSHLSKSYSLNFVLFSALSFNGLDEA